MAFGEAEDVEEVGAAPGVDALGIVAHRHDLVVGSRQQVHQIALELVGVLVFIHQYMLETALVLGADLGMFAQ